MDVFQILGTTLGIGFAAGLRLYATVLGLGLAIRFGFLQLPDAMKTLDVLAHPVVLITAGVMYALEFISDKIPWVDSLWDAVHTVVRPVGAAALAGAAFGNFDPVTRTTLVLLCGGVAFTSHATKAATRLAVNQSPEPFSNIALSLLGDAAVPFLVWMTVSHPLLTFGLVIGFLALFIWLAGKLWRMLRGGIQRLRERWA